MIGTRLAHYEVESHLGSGGMGDVYQARDTRLGRKIALKLLPDAFARDPERLARFEREARVLASLNHPNIAALHGLEQADDRRFLVMELVEGDTVANRIARGPLPVVEALQVAHQMAEALEVAHAKGIVHRDLKPSNVKVTPEGKVKILDFGLARALEPASGDSASAPTLTSPTVMTHAGVILGTAAYMSPEQAKGREVDQRADIFAFGCVLFEMLTGRRSFPGDTITESIASVLAREADLTLLPANIHPRIHDLLRRCLEKDPARRWQAIGDVRVEIDAILPDPHGLKVVSARAQPAPFWKRALPIAATALVSAAATVAIIRGLQPSPVSPSPVRFSFTLPKDQSFTRTGRHILAISPDGASVAYVANNQIYLRRLSEPGARPIAGTNQDVNTPTFSPDGRWVAFCAVPESKLRKIATTGGAAVTLADIENPYGADWYADDAILLGQGAKGIVRVSANGGKPETIVTVKPGEIAQTPQMLPDGQTVLFTLASAGANQDWDKAQIVAQSLKSGQRKVLVDGGSDGRYVFTGHIVYALGSTVYAVPFDPRALEVTGGAAPVVEGVVRASCCTAAAFFSTSRSGSFVAIPGSGGALSSRVIALVQRSGATKVLDLPPADYRQPRFSPDGRQIALTLFGAKETNVWVHDLTVRTAPRRLTFGGDSFFPVWTPDGKRIVFQRADTLWWQAADGSGSAEQLITAEAGHGTAPHSFARNGSLLSFGRVPGIWTLGVDGDRTPKLLVQAPTGASRLSPDGRWVAYTSAESTKDEVYVQPVPPTGAKYLVSANGGSAPLWSPDGRQLFYMAPSGGATSTPDTVMVVDIRTGPSFSFGAPVALPIKGFTVSGYDISPDGRQFIMTFPPSETASGTTAPLQIDIVLNWFTELAKQR